VPWLADERFATAGVRVCLESSHALDKTDERTVRSERGRARADLKDEHRRTLHSLQHLVERLVLGQRIPELLNASGAQSLAGMAHDATERGEDVLGGVPERRRFAMRVSDDANGHETRRNVLDDGRQVEGRRIEDALPDVAALGAEGRHKGELGFVVRRTVAERLRERRESETGTSANGRYGWGRTE